MGSILVVANQTLGGEALSAHLRQMIHADPSVRFVVLVPVAAPVLDVGGAMGAMGGVAMIDTSLQDHLSDVAKERLRVVLEWFRAAGAEAEGSVVGDPMVAIQAAVAAQSFEEIVISTLPARVSGWLRQDLAHRAARKFAVPVTTITAADDTLPAAPAQVTRSSTATSTSTTSTSTTSSTTTSSTGTNAPRERAPMGESVYKIIELVGTSTESWEKAAAAAVTRASGTLRDLRVAEVAQLDLVIENGVVSAYRAKVKVSFKYEEENNA
jgi:flavin-binding protein dodecin